MGTDVLSESKNQSFITDYKSEKQNNSSSCHFRAVMIFEQLNYSFSVYWTYVAKIKAIFMRDTHQVLKCYLIFGSSSGIL